MTREELDDFEKLVVDAVTITAKDPNATPAVKHWFGVLEESYKARYRELFRLARIGLETEEAGRASRT